MKKGNQHNMKHPKTTRRTVRVFFSPANDIALRPSVECVVPDAGAPDSVVSLAPGAVEAFKETSWAIESREACDFCDADSPATGLILRLL